MEDVCSFGHQLVPGSDPIIIRQIEGELIVKEERKLLRRHAPWGKASSIGVTNPTKLVAYPCAHALPQSEVPEADVPIPSFQGPSYGRGHWLTYSTVRTGSVVSVRAQCPVCLGEPAPDWRA